jgi:protein tyrosine/serine phosphatase
MLVVRTLILAAAAALLALSAEGIRVFVGGNFHTIDAQRLYRCSQPSPERLRGLIKTYGIKTVVNLRGCCDPTPWYRDEATICQEMGANLEDLAFSANRLPSSKTFNTWPMAWGWLLCNLVTKSSSTALVLLPTSAPDMAASRRP